MSVTPATGGPAWGGTPADSSGSPKGRAEAATPGSPQNPSAAGAGPGSARSGEVSRPSVAAPPNGRPTGSGAGVCPAVGAMPHPGASGVRCGRPGVAGRAGVEAGAGRGARRRHPGRPGVLTGAIVGAGSCPQGQARSAPAASGAVVPGSSPGSTVGPAIGGGAIPPASAQASGGGTGAGQASGRGAGWWIAGSGSTTSRAGGSHRQLGIGPGAGLRGAGGLRPCRAGDRLDDRLPGRRPLRGDRWGLRARWTRRWRRRDRCPGGTGHRGQDRGKRWQVAGRGGGEIVELDRPGGDPESGDGGTPPDRAGASRRLRAVAPGRPGGLARSARPRAPAAGRPSGGGSGPARPPPGEVAGLSACAHRWGRRAAGPGGGFPHRPAHRGRRAAS